MACFYKTTIFFLILINIPIYPLFDRSLFFRVSSFWGEPRLERNFLGTVDFQLSGGSTRCGHNGCGEKTNILNIYGPDFLTICDQEDPARVLFGGKFSLFEFNFNLYQNLKRGFFVHVHTPVFATKLEPESVEVQTCQNSSCSNPVAVLQNTLARNGICSRTAHNRGFGDTTLFLGWTINYEGTTYLDYVDFTIRTGVLFPTGKRRDGSSLFEIPYGYDGHWGLPWAVDLSVGAYNWLTFGVHGDGVYLFNRTRCVNFNSTNCKTGFIKFGMEELRVKSGAVNRAGFYTKADHVVAGFSVLTAFTYEQKNSDRICNNSVAIDEQFKKWSRWIFQILFEWDVTHCDEKLGTRIGLSYNKQITGKRVFDTDITMGYLGLDITYVF